MSIFHIQSFKRYNEKSFIACEQDDKDACMFRIGFTVHGAGFGSDVEVESLHVAKNIIMAMDSAFESGRQQAFKEVRNLIGVK